MVKIAEKALENGIPLIEPRALVEYFDVEALKHNRLVLTNGGYLQGDLIREHLATAQKIAVIVVTIGEKLENLAYQVMPEDATFGLALDGLGTAAVDRLSNLVTVKIEQEAASKGLQTSLPISPGLIGWPTDKGQSQIFKLVDSSKIGIKLTESMMMIPVKSVSVVIGLGKDMEVTENMCEYCSMRDTCRFSHYNKEQHDEH